METVAAQLKAQSAEDRVFTTRAGIIVLDGATSHDPSTPPAQRYVDTLGRELQNRLDTDRHLSAILADSIRCTASALDLRPGQSPSSTVALVRIWDDILEVLVLGDSAVVVGFTDGSHTVMTDDRLTRLGLPESATYKRRLATGSGFDQQHRDLLRRLQCKEHRYRNRPGGFWIAEADPEAAQHAITYTCSLKTVAWAIATTDGAFDTLCALKVPWEHIARNSQDELSELLNQCATWESDADPDGRALPRSKRHDDKTIAVIRPQDRR
ncbi:PP2C family serine/threonine-protein phosphatase [Nocardia sp. NPDC047648]|uniref:PP2C family serine/threonine-protein phosphatase n=1 Tax=Nocardia sp. NPDC047648 TaxID=3155625 RepID=UPI0033D07AF5